MKAKTEQTKSNKDTFNKEAFLHSDTYMGLRDVIGVVMSDDERITKDELDNRIKEYFGKVVG